LGSDGAHIHGEGPCETTTYAPLCRMNDVWI
jgi:hypothetical protein